MLWSTLFGIAVSVSFFLNLTDLPYLLDLSNFLNPISTGSYHMTNASRNRVNHLDLLDFLYLPYLADLPDHPVLPNFLNHPDLHTASLEWKNLHFIHCKCLQGFTGWLRGFSAIYARKTCNICRDFPAICKYYRVFPADKPLNHPVNPCKHLQCSHKITATELSTGSLDIWISRLNSSNLI